MEEEKIGERERWERGRDRERGERGERKGDIKRD